MEILYVSKLCSKKKFEEIFAKCRVKPQQQAQKFHQLLVTGLAGQEGVQITALSGLPISRLHSKKIWWMADSEVENRTTYRYLSHLNLPLLGQVVAFISAFSATVNWILRNSNKEKYIVCDALNLSVSSAARIAGSLSGVKTVAIVTDLPDQMRNYIDKGSTSRITLHFYRLFSNFMLQRYRAYILITEEMNAVVNAQGCPFLVMEGLVQYIVGPQEGVKQNKVEERVIMYAGALYEKYGVRSLLKAFMLMPEKSVQLWLFGMGSLQSEIQASSFIDPRIRYFGVLPNEEVVALEHEVALLVNPRPSSEEFTKYSFPIKNLEYMASGTPLLTTKLSGMPKDYYDYVFLFEDETVDGMAKEMERVLNLPISELHAKGAAARDFVLREKNNLVQAQRIVKLLSKSL